MDQSVNATVTMIHSLGKIQGQKQLAHLVTTVL